MFGLLLISTLFLSTWGSSVNVQQNITAQGYPAETYHVTTEDGYILELHRIPYGKSTREESKNSTRKVVLIMHSILAGSNSFIYAGPKTGIAFNLADAECDVWLGNSRGNRYSRQHVSLNPENDKFKFWDFTYEELALYDLPAIIDYILAKTKQEKLHYIGHTQGGTLFLVLNSLSTKYHSKIASAHLLAGIGYEKYFPQTILKIFSKAIDLFYSGLLLTGIVEIFPTPFVAKIFEAFINIFVPYELVCGASAKQIIHFGQNFRDEAFNRFNLGAGNFLKYGRLSPPPYDLSKIKVDVTFYYARNDTLQGFRDVLNMAEDLPNAKVHRIARDDFNHYDYLASKDAKELVTDYIIEYLRKY